MKNASRKLLAKAKKEALESIDAKNAEELKQRVEELERSLQEANEKLQRARSMAEQTRAGYVYIVSSYRIVRGRRCEDRNDKTAKP